MEEAEEALKMDTAIQKAQEKQNYILRDKEALQNRYRCKILS